VILSCAITSCTQSRVTRLRASLRITACIKPQFRNWDRMTTLYCARKLTLLTLYVSSEYCHCRGWDLFLYHCQLYDDIRKSRDFIGVLNTEQEHRHRYIIRPIYVWLSRHLIVQNKNKSVYKSWKFEHKLPRKKAITFFVCDLDLEVRVMKAARDTPSSDGACVYEVSSNYVERIKRYVPDKQKVNGHTDTQTHRHTDNPRHTIIRPVDDGRIKTAPIVG
jgi:hypothetical protein